MMQPEAAFPCCFSAGTPEAVPDGGAGEGRVQDNGGHVGVEAYWTVDVRFDVVVQVVSCRLVPRAT